MNRDASVGLVRYDAACRAIAAARSTDEVRRIRSGAAALAAYAKQAKNRQLEIDAAEIRIRAERRVGELIQAQAETVGLAKGRAAHGPRGSKSDPRNGDKPSLKEAGIDKHLADRARKLARVPAAKFDAMIDDWRARANGGIERVGSDLFAGSKPLAVHHSSETAEHYTPPAVIALVVACLGAIDLDPCADPDEAIVPASARFTKTDDGLARPWFGRVYMNPPYGSEIDAWVEKLCAEHQSGNVIEAIALVPARTDTQWFHRLRDFVCCFVTGRLTFVGNTDPAPFPSALFYLGEEIGKFNHCFEELGDVWQRIEPGMYGD